MMKAEESGNLCRSSNVKVSGARRAGASGFGKISSTDRQLLTMKAVEVRGA